MSMYSADVIKRVLDSLDPEAVLQKIDYRITTVQKRGDQIRCFCPIHKEAVFRTLSIQCDTGRYRCSYTLCGGARGGDLIDLYAQASRISYDEAMRALAEAFHLSIELPAVGDVLDQKLNEGRNYLDLEAIGEAQEAFEQILKADPANLEAHHGLLRALVLGKKTTEARDQRLRLAAMAQEQGHWENAQAALEEQLDEQPEDDEARQRLIALYEQHELTDQLVGQYMAMAERCESQSQIDEALKMYRAVEQTGATVVDVFPHVVRLLREAGRHAEAVAEHLKRAESLEAEGYKDLALEELGQALEIDPERKDIRMRAIEGAAAGSMSQELAGRVLQWIDGFLERSQYDEALESLELVKPRLKADERVEQRMLQALEAQGKQADADELRGRIIEEWIASGGLDQAQKRLDQLLEERPDSIHLARRKAQLLVETKDIEGAFAAYGAVLDQLTAAKELRKACEIYEEMLQLRPDDLALREEFRQTLIQLGEVETAQAMCLDLAERYLEVNRGAEALERLGEAVQFAPEDMDLRMKLAKAAERLGKPELAVAARLKGAEQLMAENAFTEAVGQLEGALKLDPQNPGLLDRLAICYQQLGDTVRACRNLEELAAVLEREKDWAQCEAVLRRMIQVDPAHMGARERLAAVLGSRGRGDEELAILQETARRYLADSSYSRAEEVCHRILEKRPNQVDALEILIRISEAAQKRQAAQGLYRRLAEVYKSQDDRPNERKTYERILERWPDDDEIRRNYVLLLWDQQDLQRMRNEARRLVEVLLRLRRFEQAADFLTHVQRMAAGEALFHELAVETYEQWGKDKQWAQSVQALVDLYRRRNLPAEAAQWLGRLVERNPAEEALRAEYIQLLLKDEKVAEAAEQYAQLGRIHQEKGALADAVAAFQSALDLDPAHEDVMMALVRLHTQQKNAEEALRLITGLAAIREHRDDYDGAIAVLRMAFEIDRDSIAVRQKIIEVLAAKGAQDEALAELENLRVIHESAGDWEAAAAVLRRKVEMAPDNPQPREELIDLLKRRGKQDERLGEELALAGLLLKNSEAARAVEILDRLAEEDPSLMPVRKLRAEAYAANGDDKKALEEFMYISSRLGELRQSTAETESATAPVKLKVLKDYVFENFVVGTRNNFAYATSLAVAREPGQTYNPLFLYSDVGLGKTHLLHAIANQLMAEKPELKLLYTSADEFISELVEAIETNTIKQFRSRHKSTDVLLLDDVQFLAGKERAQEEFFHIFNTLFQSQRQIVVTSDRPPKDMPHLEKRLVSRFGAGVIVDIQPPDMETRVAILLREMKAIDSNGFPESLAAKLAERLETNVRELKGAFNQIVAISRLREGQISDPDLDELIDEVMQKVAI